jgi:hypothetical protein
MDNKNVTKYLKLPFHFEEEALKKDLETISTEYWIPQVYKMNYKGEWTSIALISRGGDNNNFAYGRCEKPEQLRKIPSG